MKRKEESETSEEDASESEGTIPARPELKKDTPVKSSKAAPPPSSSGEEEDDEDEDDSDSTSAVAAGGAVGKPAPPKGPAAAKRPRDDKADSQQEAKKMKTDEQPAKGTPKKKEGKAKGGENNAAEVANNGTNKKTEKKDEQPAEKETKDPAKSNFKRTWNARDEAALAQQLLEDLKAGVDFRNKAKSDSYWTELLETLKPKLDGEYTRDQVFDKHRRIRNKYEKSGGSRSRKRTPSDEALYNLMKQIWGPEAVRPAPANSKGTAIKAAMSDDEESNGEMDTSALEPKKLEHLLNDAVKTGDGSKHRNPMSSFVASVCSEMVNGYKLGSAAAAAAGMTGKLRTHVLEVMEAECDVMKRRLQVASEIYTQEMELIKKLRNNRH